MNAWPFVTAAYVITLGGAAIITGWSWLAMGRAERAVDAMRDARADR